MQRLPDSVWSLIRFLPAQYAKPYANKALAEAMIGLFKAEAVRDDSPFRTGPLLTLADVENVTSAWVDWYNNSRLVYQNRSLIPTPRVSYNRQGIQSNPDYRTPIRVLTEDNTKPRLHNQNDPEGAVQDPRHTRQWEDRSK